MKLKRSLTVTLVVPALALAGCGSKSDTASTTSSASTTAGSAAGASASATDCPTENTKSFAKTRFVADIGIAAGTFHRWIWKPYQEGKFKKGAKGRTAAIVKAVGIAALDAKLLSNAADNAKANPTLCKTLAAPISKAAESVNTLKGQITSGDLAAIASTEALISSVFAGAKKAGFDVQESTDTSSVGG